MRLSLLVLFGLVFSTQAHAGGKSRANAVLGAAEGWYQLVEQTAIGCDRPKIWARYDVKSALFSVSSPFALSNETMYFSDVNRGKMERSLGGFERQISQSKLSGNSDGGTLIHKSKNCDGLIFGCGDWTVSDKLEINTKTQSIRIRLVGTRAFDCVYQRTEE